MFKLYLYYKGIHKTTEEHFDHLSAVRSGENWRLLNKDNTIRIESTARSLEDLLRIY